MDTRSVTEVGHRGVPSILHASREAELIHSLRCSVHHNLRKDLLDVRAFVLRRSAQTSAYFSGEFHKISLGTFRALATDNSKLKFPLTKDVRFIFLFTA